MQHLSIPGPMWSIAKQTVADCAAPGALLDAKQRSALARRSRAQRAGIVVDPADGGLERLTDILTLDAHRIDAGVIDGLRTEQIVDAILVEVVAMIARLTAVDTFCFALGIDPIDFPEAVDDPPTGRIDTRASRNGGWLPTVGPASPPNALSALPDEHVSMHELHSSFYLAIADMADLDADRGLHRTQMELVASRASLLNECFF